MPDQEVFTMSSDTDMRGGRRWRRRAPATVLAVVATAISTGSAEAANRLSNPRHWTRDTPSLASIAGADSGQSGAMLGGFTSQGWPGFFQLSPNGRMLLIGAIGVDMSCQPSGVKYSIEDGYSRVPISSGGRLHSSFTASPTLLADGTTVGMSGSMAGSVNRARTRLSGSWQLRATFAQPGQPADHCSSGNVRFTATR
jgi:hypothetical protein